MCKLLLLFIVFTYSFILKGTCHPGPCTLPLCPCCAQFWPPPDYYPPSIGRFRVRCGGGVGGEVRIRQSDSDFNERGNNLAGGRKWAQHSSAEVPLSRNPPPLSPQLKAFSDRSAKDPLIPRTAPCFPAALRHHSQSVCPLSGDDSSSRGSLH